MDLKEIENALKKASEGNFSARADESKVDSELKAVAQLLNKTLEKAALAKELKHRADVMIQYNPMAIAILGKDKSRIHINKAYETLWRGTREELLKKKLTDFDITVLSGEHFYACFDTKKLAITDCLVTFPDGIKKYLTLNAIPILTKNGDVDGAFYVWIDNTDLREKIEAVKEVEQRVDRIIQENPFPLFTIDAELNVKICNQAFLELTGYSKERTSSLSMKDFKYLKNKGDTVEGTIKSRKRSQGESTIEFPSGTFVLEWYYIPLLDADGHVESLLIVFNDITDRRKKEKEVKQLMEESHKKAETLSVSAAVLENGLERISRGDLTFIAPLVDGDPLFKLKKDYNISVDSIKKVIQELEKSVKQIEVTTQDTSRGTTEISKSTEQVAVGTQKSADGAKKQLDEIEKVGKEVSDLSASIEEIASTSQDLLTHAPVS